MPNNRFSERLAQILYPLYAPPKGMGGHDDLHCVRMINMYEEFSTLIVGVDREEYAVSVILHNLDRFMPKDGFFPEALEAYLSFSEFEAEAQERIRDTVLTHSKCKDEPSDSPLLQMLRLADKWDRYSMVGITSGLAWKGNEMSAYSPTRFSYGSTAEGEEGWKYHYENFYRMLEWYRDFPMIRTLVQRHPQRFRHMLYFVRAWAEDVADIHRIKNTVEDDLKKCLGEYYKDWLPV